MHVLLSPPGELRKCLLGLESPSGNHRGPLRFPDRGSQGCCLVGFRSGDAAQGESTVPCTGKKTKNETKKPVSSQALVFSQAFHTEGSTVNIRCF